MPPHNAAARDMRQYDVSVPHPQFVAGCPTLEDMEACPHYPVYISCNPQAPDLAVEGCQAPDTCIPFNCDEAIPFESDLFSGKLSVRVRGLATTDPAWFQGKKRFTHTVIQGRFKAPVAAADMWTGFEFPSLPSWIPRPLVSMLYTTAAKAFASTVWVSSETDEASGQVAGFMTPLLASCQLANFSLPGQEPDMWAAEEDCTLLGPELVDPSSGRALSADKRRKFFDKASHLKGLKLSPDYVFTFHMWQHYCDPSTYKLQLGGLATVDMLRFAAGQPLQLMAKDLGSGKYYFNLLVWHKGLLFKKDKQTAEVSSGKSEAGGKKLAAAARSLLGLGAPKVR